MMLLTYLHIIFLALMCTGSAHQIRVFQKAGLVDLEHLRVRGGGGSYLQPNPNYINPNPQQSNEYSQYMQPTLGEIENDHFHRPIGNNPYAGSTSRPPKPLKEVAIEFFQRLYRTNQTMFYGVTLSLAVFIAWQIPQLNGILQRNFVASNYNIKRGRIYTLVTSIVSHATLSHLLLNLFAFLAFGKSIQPLLNQNRISFGAYCILAGVLANLFFLKVHPQGSCIGLSGVTLSFLALDAKLHPSKTISFLFRFIPIQLPAQYALTALLLWSTIGMMATLNGRNRDGVAHATHLFGLIYGIGVYELVKSGLWHRFLLFQRKIRRKISRKGKRLGA